MTHLGFDVHATNRTPDDFHGAVKRWAIGELMLVDCAASPFVGNRGDSLIGTPDASAQSDDILGFQFVYKVVELVREGGRELALSAGDIVLWDGLQPTEIEIVEPFYKRTLLFPRERVLSVCPRLGELSALPSLDGSGSARLLVRYANALASELPTLEPAAGVAAAARATSRPVRWTETRSEHLVAMHHGRAQRARFEIGGSRDGEVKALRIDLLQDGGAYPGIGAFLANLTALMSSGVYRIPKIEAEVRAVVTNTTQTGPVRGAGRPEATQMLERAMDVFAADCGLDPAEVRRRSFPHTTASGATYDIGDYPPALELALQKADYDGLRREQQARRVSGAIKQLGIGLSTYVEITNGISESEFGSVEITADGEAIVHSGSFSHGQGHETTFGMIVAERLGMPLEKVSVRQGDTDAVPCGTGTYGSKSTQIPDRWRRRRQGLRGGGRARQEACRRRARGERRAASGERRAASGERRAASGERRAASGERRGHDLRHRPRAIPCRRRPRAGARVD